MEDSERERQRAEGKRIIAKYARMMRNGRRPIPCTPSDLEKRSPTHRRQGPGTDYKIIYDSREIAEAAAREMHAIFGDEQSAHPCGRSESGHFHLTKKRKPQGARLWTDRYDARQGHTWRTHRDGRVAVWGFKADPPRPNLWWATAWTKDPRRHGGAESAQLLVGGTWDELQGVLTEWERTS